MRWKTARCEGRVAAAAGIVIATLMLAGCGPPAWSDAIDRAERATAGDRLLLRLCLRVEHGVLGWHPCKLERDR